MTDQEMRIAIAEACGVRPLRRWKWSYNDGQTWSIDHYSQMSSEAERVRCRNMGYDSVGTESVEYDEWERAPKYLQSLDDMHSAWLTLDSDDRREFDEILMDEVGIHGAIHASARQRAQAFVRTIAARAEREAKV